jgi:hypothetical protein
MNPIRPLILFCLLTAVSTGWPRERPFIDNDWSTREDVEDPQPWKEGGFVMPPYPDEEDLVEFPVDDPDSRFRYFVDAHNLSVGDDGVVRYTLVIRADAGADNVSVEGMRCNERQVRVYAYGGVRGKLHVMKDSQWEPIRRSGPYRYHTDLREFYFCDLHAHEPHPVSEIRHLLQAAPRRNDTSSFL